MFSSYSEFEIEFQPRNGEVYPISASGNANASAAPAIKPARFTHRVMTRRFSNSARG